MKTSIIWSISTEKLKEIVSSSTSYASILRILGLKPGITTNNLKTRLNAESIDYSHLKDGQGCLWNKGKQLISKEEVIKFFCKNSPTDRKSIKNYILKFNLKKYVCSICGQEPIWKGKSMTLILDHENGVRNDNSLSNLRFVCPNCNSQLLTTYRSNSKSAIWDVSDLQRKLKDGKSKRQCLLELGLSDGVNYRKLDSVLSNK